MSLEPPFHLVTKNLKDVIQGVPSFNICWKKLMNLSISENVSATSCMVQKRFSMMMYSQGIRDLLRMSVHER